MIPGTGKLPHWHRGLVFKVLVFLSLALAPIGVIAVMQSKRVADSNRSFAVQSTLAATEAAVVVDRKVLERTFGAAEALGGIVSVLDPAGDACLRIIDSFLASNPEHRYAGYIDAQQQNGCSSAGDVAQISDQEQDWLSQQSQSRQIGANIFLTEATDMADTVYQPIFKKNEFLGYFVLSLPKEIEPPAQSDALINPPLGVLTFNTSGRLVPLPGDQNDRQLLPEEISLQSIATASEPVFTALDQTGTERVYSRVPVLGGAATSLVVWDPGQTPVVGLTQSGWLMLSPILMWGASILVAMFSLERLVIRPVRNLGRQMDNFALRRELPVAKRTGNMPSEIILMQENLRQMALHVTQDEAELEGLIHKLDNLLKQKSLLLKEVHHRVKNNLQLISSIMNMQLRETKNPETTAVLRRLQDRIMSLASAHQVLHQTDSVDKLDAGHLLKNLAEQLKRIAGDGHGTITADLEVDQIELIPDQAVPFALLASELITNAYTYATQSNGDPSTIAIALRQSDDDMVELSVTNAIADVRPSKSTTGLGTRLVRAFTTQLDGDISRDETPDSFTVSVKFKVMKQPMAVLDY